MKVSEEQVRCVHWVVHIHFIDNLGHVHVACVSVCASFWVRVLVDFLTPANEREHSRPFIFNDKWLRAQPLNRLALFPEHQGKAHVSCLGEQCTWPPVLETVTSMCSPQLIRGRRHLIARATMSWLLEPFLS